ncbi:amidohydrolase family protein [Xanthobacter sp. VTT E-85241]|uniref:amidohydrolase family protein n=1 Tax=Roseixanthobacter finlandensis TaxID=3119922 RepID=UPI003728E453
MSDPIIQNGEPPACPGPDPHPRGATRFKVPVGAVDTHAHVIGAPPDYPLMPNRSYTAPVATAADYLGMLDATGMTYGVLVQVSVHGTDNRLMLETLRANPARLRGVAVADLGLSDAVYAELKEAGVAGLRINALFGGGVSLDLMERYGDLCAEMGWHLQFLLDARDLGELGPRIRKLRAPAVVDHMGHFPASEGIEHPGFQELLRLVAEGGWVKLSGAYRLSVEGAPYRDTTPLARALVEVAPERCVWGSDWPHVSTWTPMPNVGDLLDLLADWVPDEATRNRILSDNAHRLYGFKS